MLVDENAAYEQVQVVPEHVNRTAMSTPDGNMESLVMQIGDCNAPATFQVLMNHIFSPYIGLFMDVYLDDIVIYSDTLEDHIKHCKIVFDTLAKEKLYLSPKKVQILPDELKILGRIVDKQGIKMDPSKVDKVVNWKIPTTKELLQGFLRSVGFLADDIAGVQVPMGVLHSLTGSTVPFRWTETHQRAFDEVKDHVQRYCDHSQVPLVYGNDTLPINLITDASSTGISGIVSQGEDWWTAKVAAFFSAKLNAVQQNYPVHEHEMFAGVETMKRYRDILQGAQFRWFTDHKGLIHLLKQKNLSGCQARS